jgi:protein-disulfide isomerase
MNHRTLIFLSFTFLTLVTFLFFWLRIQPIEPNLDDVVDPIAEITEPTITFVNPARGAEEPLVTIIEFGDFECAPCKTLASTLESILINNPDTVKLVWKDLPNESLHEFATPAAVAAHCADRQGAFWQYHDQLFERQTYLSNSQFTQIATDLGLNVNKFEACYQTQDTLPIVKRDYEEGIGLGITSTPTIIIGNEMLSGAVSVEAIYELIKEVLATSAE